MTLFVVISQTLLVNLMTLTICYIPLIVVILAGMSLFLFMMFIKLSQSATVEKPADRTVFLPFCTKNVLLFSLFLWLQFLILLFLLVLFLHFWKHAHVIPIPKMKNPTIRDLRPISLLSLPSQIFEHFIFNSVSNTLYKSYDDDQGGCRPQSSTCCASMLLVCLIQLQFLVSRSLLLTQLTTTSFQYLNTALLLAPTFSSPNCAMTGPWTSQKNKY